jgi:F-type H+-transporting ATPase subunit a
MATDSHNQETVTEINTHAQEGVATEVHEETHEEGGHAPSLSPHVFGHVGPFPITDALIGALVVVGVLSSVAIMAGRKFALIPSRIQIFFEMIAEFLLNELEAAFGSKEDARKMFPIICTLVLFVLVANQLVLLPFVFQFTWDGVLLVRQPTTSLNMTLALAMIVIGISHVLAMRISPSHHIMRFFPINKVFSSRSIGELFSAGIDMFVGALELIGEFAKTLSLAARLFGNLFAGMVMGEVVRELVPFIAPIPFAAIEIFAGLVQTFVFMLLSIQFIALTVAHARPHIEHVRDEGGNAHGSPKPAPTH